MSEHLQSLRDLQKQKDFFVGIDSDGCAFDTMEIKHKECFIPNIINYWDLQFVSKMAREVAEFINLYSEWRGVNRFPGLVMVFDFLAARPEAIERGYKSPQVDSLRAWLKAETALGNPALEKAVKAGGASGPVTATNAWWVLPNKNPPRKSAAGRIIPTVLAPKSAGRSLLPRALFMAISLQALAALVLVHLQTAFLLKVAHGI